MIKDKYNFKDIENNRYNEWKEEGFFYADPTNDLKPFTIVIPPPNITAKLHIGHAWDNTIQDIIIRKKRMEGFDALYLPGTDHAGIATQARIDQMLKAEGTNRFILGRDEFMKRAFEWQAKYQGLIYSQWAALGLSVDYSKIRFTLDQDLSDAVYTVFKTLYDKGVIYRDYRITNWDPEAKTALSNVEVIYKEMNSKLYYINYPLVDSKEFLEIATTRPETMFADQALMVNPDDKRYLKYIGKFVYIPNTKVKIPVISDPYVDKKFGTGVVKVTPAHDPNDFQVAKRHNLKMPLCMNPDGTMNEMTGKYNGLDRFTCRKDLVNDLNKLGFLTKIKDHKNNIGFSERTNAMVEPRLSMQWYVRMKELAEDALKTDVEFVPKRFKNNYKRWLENIQDWCISRQLWWGHRIPAYYDNFGNVVIAKESPGKDYVQDEDVLDTWFSSALWPFATLGWPNTDSKLYQKYYPTNVLVTGYDIIFFWVARMIFQGRHFTFKDPFKQCLLHGLIRDKNGIKMSKSLGNGVDPIDIINNYGADALRLFLTTNSSPGMDIRFDETKLQASASLINKLYNIARFMQLKDSNITNLDTNFKLNNIFDKFIINKLNQVIKEANKLYDKYLFSEASKVITNFLWDDFAQNYLEISKINKDDVENTNKILKYVLINILKLMHPFIPFVTDYLYTELTGKKNLMVSKWPEAQKLSSAVFKEYDLILNVINLVRKTKADNKLLNKTPINLVIKAEKHSEKILVNISELLKKYLFINTLEFNKDYKITKDNLVESYQDIQLIFEKSELSNTDQADALEKRLKELEGELLRSKNLLSNKNFLAKASSDKIAIEKEKQAKYEQEYKLVKEAIKDATK